MDNAFYEADDEAFETAKEGLSKLFKKGLRIKQTNPGSTTDAAMTATTDNGDIVCTVEIKNREDNYTYKLFAYAEKNKTGVLSKGVFINQKKINSLLVKAKENSTIPIYCMCFTDGVIALWHIKPSMKLDEITAYYSKWNVHPEQKEWQTNKTLLLSQAVIIYDTINDRIIQGGINNFSSK